MIGEKKMDLIRRNKTDRPVMLVPKDGPEPVLIDERTGKRYNIARVPRGLRLERPAQAA